jgi:hypothetical protein
MNGGEEPAAWLVPNEIEDELHVGRPCFVNNKVHSSLFQDVFVRPGKWFRPDVGGNWMMTISRQACMLFVTPAEWFGHAGSNCAAAGREHVRPDPYRLLGPRSARDAPSQGVGWFWFNTDRGRA